MIKIKDYDKFIEWVDKKLQKNNISYHTLRVLTGPVKPIIEVWDERYNLAAYLWMNKDKTFSLMRDKAICAHMYMTFKKFCHNREINPEIYVFTLDSSKV